MGAMGKHKGWRRWFAVPAMAAVLAVTTAVTPVMAAEAAPIDQFNEVFTLIEQHHYSGISAEELRDAAIEGMIERLEDPYTLYYNEEAWQEMQNAFEQTYAGIGIQFFEREQGLQILKVYAGSAAEEAGLQPGDMIVGVAGKRLTEYGLDELLEDLYGLEGTDVALEVVKAADGSSREVTVTRKLFHIPTVEYGMMDGGAGYIRIDSFSSETAGLVGEALTAFAEEPDLKSLILDIRGNPGGYLDSVEAIAQYFIGTGILLRTVGNDGDEKLIVSNGEPAVRLPVTILVDGNSASASEVFAGAMQDHELAVIVGTRTYGKGSVQQLIPLQTGGGLRVTIEHYFTPNGSEVDGVGITPDVRSDRPFDQTLKAVRTAGIRSIQVELLPYETVVNGVAFDHTVQTLREDGRAYLPSVAVASLLDGDVTWHGDTSSVSISGLGKQVVFDASNGLKLQDGISYIDADMIAKQFPALKVTVEAESIMLELN